MLALDMHTGAFVSKKALRMSNFHFQHLSINNIRTSTYNTHFTTVLFMQA